MNLAVVTQAAAGLVGWLAAQGGDGPLVIGYDARHGSRAVRRAHRPGGHRRGPAGAAAAPPAAHPGAGVRGAAARRGGRGDGHGQPQPAAGQRLQGLPGRASWAARWAPARRSCRRPTPASRRPSGRSARWPRCRWAGPARCSATTSSPRTSSGPPRWSTPDGPRDLSVAYTPLHGVGAAVLTAAFARAGFPTPGVVPEQAEPDPAFPTVAFPNPEEPGAVDLLIALADATGADLADRQRPGRGPLRGGRPRTAGRASWRMLRGDEVGVLLADHLMRRGVTGLVRHHHRVVVAAAGDVRGPWDGLRRDADRLQVDRPGRRRERAAGLRLRGGARLLRGPGARPGQGRHHRRADRSPSWPPGSRRRVAR